MTRTPSGPAWEPPAPPEVSPEWDEPVASAPGLPARAARWTWIAGALCAAGMALLALSFVGMAQMPLPEFESTLANVLPPSARTPQVVEKLREVHAQAGGLGRAFGLVALGMGLLHALLGVGIRQASRTAIYTALVLAIGQAVAVAYLLLNAILAIFATGNLAMLALAAILTAVLAVLLQTIRLLWQARRLESQPNA